MIRVITPHNRDQFSASLDQYFRLRYEVFVSELGWSKPNDSLKEADQYDDDNAVYVLSIDRNEDVVGCFRLYPTVLPHMLIDHFGSLVDGPLLQRRDVLEATRFAIREQNRRGGIAYRELYLGMLEYCLSEGILGTVAVVRTSRITPLLGIGLRVRPLGLPQQIGLESNTAIYYDIDEDVLALVRTNAGVPHSVIENTRHSALVA